MLHFAIDQMITLCQTHVELLAPLSAILLKILCCARDHCAVA